MHNLQNNTGLVEIFCPNIIIAGQEVYVIHNCQCSCTSNPVCMSLNSSISSNPVCMSLNSSISFTSHLLPHTVPLATVCVWSGNPVCHMCLLPHCCRCGGLCPEHSVDHTGNYVPLSQRTVRAQGFIYTSSANHSMCIIIVYVYI